MHTESAKATAKGQNQQVVSPAYVEKALKNAITFNAIANAPNGRDITHKRRE
jgi:hypothetical protein